MSDNRLAERQNRYELRNRYVFRGLIVTQTALHIGGGKVTLSNSDSPIVLTPDQKPFIPGSSFKGALRSAVERIVPNLPARAGFTTCALLDRSDEKLPLLPPVDELHPPRWPDGECPTVWQKALSDLRQKYPRWDREIVADALAHRCSTCCLFGSPLAAARLNVGDLYIPVSPEGWPEYWSGLVQTRDGVTIDRDSEKARDRLKYDFEVAPASVTFEMKITLENATQQDLQLLCVGLSEFVHGFGGIGGKRSRGLGMAKLEKLLVWELDLEVEDKDERNRRLSAFLISGRFSREELPGEAFLHDQIERIFSEGGA